MKKHIRILCLVLAVLTLLPLLFACGKKDEEKNPGNTASTTVQGEKKLTTLPDYNWEGKTFRVLGRDGGATSQFTAFEVYAESMNTEVVNDAVWMRNNQLKETYNFNISQTLEADVGAKAQAGYAAGEDNFDLVLYKISQVQAHATTGFLEDLNAVPYVDFNQDCWNGYANFQLTIGGKLYYTVSDFLLSDKNRTYLNIYNRELARNEGLGYLEDLVTSGDWTMETAQRIVRQTSKEVDGLDGHSSDDSFGLVMDSYNAFAAFSYGGGMRISKRDSDGMITLSKVTSTTTDILDKVIALTCDTNTSMFCNDYKNDWAIANNTFYAGRALISTTFPSVFETSMNEKCTFEYGFLPFPMYDENQKVYYTVPDTSHSVLFAIPHFVQDKAFAGFCLEALSEVSTETTLHAFYEVKCKSQDSYDLRCAQMLDLIFENVVYDVALVGNFGNVANLLTSELPARKLNLYASMYRARSTAAQSEIDKIVEEYRQR